MAKTDMLNSILNKVVAGLLIVAIVGIFWIDRTARANSDAIKVEKTKVRLLAKKVDKHQEKLFGMSTDIKVMRVILERMEKDNGR